MSLRAGISSVSSCSDSDVRRHSVASGLLAAMAIHAAVVSSVSPDLRKRPGGDALELPGLDQPVEAMPSEALCSEVVVAQ